MQYVMGAHKVTNTNNMTNIKDNDILKYEIMYINDGMKRKNNLILIMLFFSIACLFPVLCKNIVNANYVKSNKEFTNLLSKDNDIGTKEMQIYFKMNGGIVGITKSITIDTNSISQQEASRLKDFVINSNFFNSHSDPPPKRGSADYFKYNITIQTDNKIRHSISTNDVTMSHQFVPLIDFLRQKIQ